MKEMKININTFIVRGKQKQFGGVYNKTHKDYKKDKMHQRPDPLST
jgi:hypothetical protein